MEKLKLKCVSCNATFWVEDYDWARVAEVGDLIPVRRPCCDEQGHAEVLPITATFEETNDGVQSAT